MLDDDVAAGVYAANFEAVALIGAEDPVGNAHLLRATCLKTVAGAIADRDVIEDKAVGRHTEHVTIIAAIAHADMLEPPDTAGEEEDISPVAWGRAGGSAVAICVTSNVVVAQAGEDNWLGGSSFGDQGACNSTLSVPLVGMS